MSAPLGFGLMRLPKENDRIKLDETIEMVDRFIDAGFTYFDTAYVYEGSEEIARKAIVERYPRDKYTMASKMACWKIDDSFTAEDMFRVQLERTGLDYFDYYLMHSLQDLRDDDAIAKGCWKAVDRFKEEGKIKHIGFSFHGTPELLVEVLERHPEAEFVQLQINYLDWDSPIVEAQKNYEIARKYGKKIVIMEPVKGGLLATAGKGIFEEGTAAGMALRFAAGLDGVMAVLSGMSDIAQMEDNIRTFTDMKPLTENEKEKIRKVVQSIRDEGKIECTSCRYCTKDCPKHIAIPDIFHAVNDLRAFGEHNRPRFFYNGLVSSGKSGKASDCIKCGRCRKVCPQHLDIPTLLGEAAEMLDK